MYKEFAYFYDELNGAADYRRLHRFIRRTFKRYGLNRGIVADLGCGTGSLSLLLAKDGYDMLSVDLSEDMLEVLAEKLERAPALRGRIQLLQQDLEALDLFGTIQGAVSTFDTFNHIGPDEKLCAAIRRAAFFMDRDAIFIFDMNTPYKHRCFLKNREYEVEAPDAACVWSSRTDENLTASITVRTTQKSNGEVYEENFSEYCYSADRVREMCAAAGLEVLQLLDGDTFRPLKDTSQRMLFVTRKQYTQNARPL